MERIKLSALGEENYQLPKGGCLVQSAEIIQLKDEAVRFVYVIDGKISVISQPDTMREALKGEICVFEKNDDILIVGEDSSVFVLRKETPESASSKKIKFPSFKLKNKGASNVTGDNAEAKELKLMDRMLPKIAGLWQKVSGHVSESVINNEEGFKLVASKVYALLPSPVRFVVREELFVGWCYERRHLITRKSNEEKEKIGNDTNIEAN